MAKKRTTSAASKKTDKQPVEQQLPLSPEQEKALKLVDRSAKVRTELEQAVIAAAVKAARKVMAGQGIALTAKQADELTSIWFGD